MQTCKSGTFVGKKICLRWKSVFPLFGVHNPSQDGPSAWAQ
jgi:hypothetical protein